MPVVSPLFSRQKRAALKVGERTHGRSDADVDRVVSGLISGEFVKLACSTRERVHPEGLRNNRADAVDHGRIERAVREILLAIGEDPQREGLRETPLRAAKAWADLTAGSRDHAALHLAKQFEHSIAGGRELVVVRNVEFHSLCEHHLLPFFGRASVAYLPANDRVCGLSKIARTVDVFARRLQMQERLTAQIANALVEYLAPVGVAVILEGEHLCMRMRGASKSDADMLTTSFRGLFERDSSARAEVIALLSSRLGQA